MNKFTLAVATMVGTIIGAGVLGIPYVFSQSGIILGLCNLIFITFTVLLMNLMLGEVTLRTKRPHMLPELAKKFLGRKGEILMFSALFAGIWGAITAYTVGVGKSLSALFFTKTILGVNASLFFSLAFFLIATVIIYFGLRAVTKTEAALVGSLLIVILVLGILAIPHIQLSNLTSISWTNIFLPYGVILFALLGTSSIPELRLILQKDTRKLKSAIMLGSIIPSIIYAVFAVYAVGVMGSDTTQIATLGLGKSLGLVAIYLGNIFAILAMASSFVILGLALRDSLTDSFQMRNSYAVAITVGVPLIIFLLGFNSFIQILSISGSLTGGLTGILVALMWWEARRRKSRTPEFTMRWRYLPWIIIPVFIGGMIYTLLEVIL